MITIARLITSDGKYTDRANSPELTLEVRGNLGLLAEKVSRLLAELKIGSVVVNSGFRTVAANIAIGGSKNSLHCRGAAIDLADPHGTLYATCIVNIPLLKKLGIYLEDGSKTKGWLHAQILPPKSGKQIFLP